MGKIVIKDNSADSAETKVEAKSEKPKKAKSSVTPGSELVVAPARAVAVVNKKKSGAKAAVTGKKTVKVEGAEEKGAGATEAKTEKKTSKSDNGTTGSKKKAAKSVSGMVIDGTVKPTGSKVKVDAAADGYAVDEEQVGRDVKVKKEGETGQPRFSKPKSALIGAGVALLVAIIGFVGIWFFSRKPVEKCVVRFEPNGGTQVNAQSLTCGTLAQEPEEPTKDGFDFKGWAFEGLMFDFENDTVTKDMTLIAWWEARPDTEVVRISFDTAGGSAVESIEIKKGGVLPTVATVPTKYGYVFAGWYLGEEVFDFSQEINENLTLTAHWREKPAEESNSGNNNSNSSSRPSSSGGGSSTVIVGMCDPMKRGEPQSVTVEVGSTVRMAATMAYIATTNCNVNYRTNDAVKIELSGSQVKGLTAGDAKVSVCLTELDGKEVECTDVPVKVTPKPVEEPKVVEVTGVAIENGSEIRIKADDNVSVVNLTAVVSPSNATNPAVSWTSDNQDVVKVNASGVVEIVGAGTATVTVRTVDKGYTATVTIIVEPKTSEEPDEPTCGDDEKLPDGTCPANKDEEETEP